MRIEDGFYYKTGLVSYDFLDLLHDMYINPKCFNCLCSHDWRVFCCEKLIVRCQLYPDVDMCPIAIVLNVECGSFDSLEGSRLPSGA